MDSDNDMISVDNQMAEDNSMSESELISQIKNELMSCVGGENTDLSEASVS